MLRRPERLTKGQTNLPTNYDRRYNNRDEISEDMNDNDNKNNNTSLDPGKRCLGHDPSCVRHEERKHLSLRRVA